jgi:hypothetical protein
LGEIATIPESYVGRLMKVATILDIQHRIAELMAEFTDFDSFSNAIEELPGPISELDIFILIKKDHPQKVTDRYRKEFIDWIGGFLQDIRKERSSSLPLNPLLHISPEEASELQLAQKLQQEIESPLGELGVEIRNAIQKNNNAEQGA